MRLSHEAITIIRERTDILAVVGDYVQLKKSGHNWVGLCPFHADRKTPSFSVNPEKGLFYCFGCGVGGDVFKFMKSIDNLSFTEAVEKLGQRIGVDVTDSNSRSAIEISAIKNRLHRVTYWSDAKPAEPSRFEEPEMPTEYWNMVAAPLLGAFPKYIIERGITVETAREWKLGRTKGLVSGWALGYPLSYYPTFEADSKRVVFSIRDEHGNLVGLSGRRIGDYGPKYFHWTGFKRNKYLYGMDKVDHSKKHLITVEGFIDVLMLSQYGFNVVGTMGGLSDSQVEIIVSLLPRDGKLYSMFDGDDAGRKNSRKLADALRNRIPVYDPKLGDGVDPKMLSMYDVAKSMEMAELS